MSHIQSNPDPFKYKVILLFQWQHGITALPFMPFIAFVFHPKLGPAIVVLCRPNIMLCYHLLMNNSIEVPQRNKYTNEPQTCGMSLYVPGCQPGAFFFRLLKTDLEGISWVVQVKANLLP